MRRQNQSKITLRPDSGFVAGAIALSIAMGGAPASAHSKPVPDFATYRFSDGVCVTGGVMYEGGQSRLLYMDVWTNKLGGLFESDGEHRSLIGDGARISFDPGSPGQISWTEGNGAVHVGGQISTPSQRSAEFSSGDVSLSGTLYLPQGEGGPLPAVVLAHGSGSVDRHSGPWVTFFVDMGFAVLSFDKRGVGQSSGDWRTSTFQDLSNDLSAAVDWLSQQPDIDPNGLGLVTSSQSGWYGPATTLANPKISFLIQRAGPGTTIGPTTLHEIQNDWRKDQIAEEYIQAASSLWITLHELLAAGAAFSDAERLVEAARRETWFTPTFGDWRLRPEWWQRRQIDSNFNPARSAGDSRIPVLWFLATNDENVPYDLSRAAIGQAHARNPRIELVTIQDANHAFLVTNENGVTFTSDYWPRMAQWLAELGLAASIPSVQEMCRR